MLRIKKSVRTGGLAVVVAGMTLAGASAALAHARPGDMSVSAHGLTLWQFPDKRALNPVIFGTPAAPLNVDLLPLAMRATSADGSAYTTLKKPLMFSNKFKKTTGSFKMAVSDRTAKDGKGSRDKASLNAEFVGPNGRNFRIKLDKLITGGGAHQMFGGVGTNVLMHGATGIGTPLVAEELSYITAWGIASLYIDGKKVDGGRVLHVMVSERTRDDNFQVGFGVANPDKLEIHLLMPPLKGSPNGPVASPVPTGVKLPNGKMQPFVHVNFYGNIKLKGDRFVVSN